ncbi:hypothetical protein ZWY2020_000174 [Hordeum vulgare]|nr:hypothetical protein ZWY2020_000174 [Hordeum vulgare]
MDWPTRVKIAAGSARGLAYLREDCHPRIIHGDIKSSNILLNDNLEAQVADFGLARLIENEVLGAGVCLDGEIGRVLLRGGAPGAHHRPEAHRHIPPLGDESLVEWSRPLLNRAIDEQEFEELVDPCLTGDYDDVEMFRMIEAAVACIRHSPARRPKMGQVVRILDSLTLNDVDLSNGGTRDL